MAQSRCRTENPDQRFPRGTHSIFQVGSCMEITILEASRGTRQTPRDTKRPPRDTKRPQRHSQRSASTENHNFKKVTFGVHQTVTFRPEAVCGTASDRIFVETRKMFRNKLSIRRRHKRQRDTHSNKVQHIKQVSEQYPLAYTKHLLLGQNPYGDNNSGSIQSHPADTHRHRHPRNTH